MPLEEAKKAAFMDNVTITPCAKYVYKSDVSVFLILSRDEFR